MVTHDLAVAAFLGDEIILVDVRWWIGVVETHSVKAGLTPTMKCRDARQTIDIGKITRGSAESKFFGNS